MMMLMMMILTILLTMDDKHEYEEGDDGQARLCNDADRQLLVVVDCI